MSVPADLPPVNGRHRNTALASARAARCVELVTQGLTYQQVADELGYAHRGSVHPIVKKALAGHIAEGVCDLRRLEGARLDELQSALWDKALAGDVRAVGVIVRIIAQRSRLLGLDGLGSSDEADLGDTVVVRS
jgi:hypothetical protein